MKMIAAEAALAKAQKDLEAVIKAETDEVFEGLKNISKERYIVPGIINRNKFFISYNHLPFFQMTVDFNPIIEKFNLTGNYVLAHWHSKPVGERHFAYFQMKDGVTSYRVIPFDQMEESTLLKVKALQIPDEEVKGLPSAVLYYPDVEIVTTDSGKFKLCDHALCELETSFSKLSDKKVLQEK